MGWNVDNYTGGRHVSGGVTQGYRLNLHRGDQGIDTWSPDIPKSQWNLLISVAQTGLLTDLDAVGASTWPDWWPQNVHSRDGGVAAVKLVLLG